MVIETKKQKCIENDYRCEICGTPINEYNSQLAHCIIKSKANIRKYGEGIMNNYHNLRIVCSLDCNSKCIVNYEKERIFYNNLLDKISKKV